MILIISQSKKLSRNISETFHYMSILSYGATPHEALSEISSRYKAALIVKPSEFPDIKDYINRIRSYKSNLPIFALTEADYEPIYDEIFDKVFTKPTLTPSLAQKIIKYANENNLSRIGEYHIGGFNASSYLVGVTYFSTPIKFTKTEAMILRYLAVSYPTPQSADMIIKYAFRANRAPEVSGIRTHISVMNSKLEKCINKKMFTFVPGKGYIVMTPEYLYMKKSK